MLYTLFYSKCVWVCAAVEESLLYLGNSKCTTLYINILHCLTVSLELGDQERKK